MDSRYDFIIVGAGPAGSVMANKLSRSGDYSVLLLEAGENNDGDELIMSPGSNLYAHFPEYFWMGESIPQKNVDGKSFKITGGRTLGGGSSVNGEMYVRPTPFVLSKWEEHGGPQWKPSKVVERFTELENYEGKTDNESARGRDGDLNIRQTFEREVPEFIEKFISAAEEATGLMRVEDYNNPETPVGPFTRWQLYQKIDGKRASASVSFLGESVVDKEGNGVRGRKLKVLTKSTATRVMFDDQKKAIGVQYLCEGTPMTAYANRKVILTAGIHSQQLLQLSGIGPEKVLKEAGIPVIYANDDVGRHYEHDSYAGAMFKVNPEDVKSWGAADPAGKFVGGAFLPNPLPDNSKEQRVIQLIPSVAGEDMLYISVMHIAAKSRGEFDIQANDPFKVMRGDFGFLSDSDDIKVLMAALRDYIAKIGEVLHEKDSSYMLVSPTKEQLDDDGKLEKYIRDGFTHTFHDQGTLRMGKQENGAVVDGNGEVYGVKDLIVADASVIPYHMDGNTSASAYIIGYTIAKHLLGEE